MRKKMEKLAERLNKSVIADNKTEEKEMNDYYAHLFGANGRCWGLKVKRERVSAFTIDLAKEIIEFANKEHAKRFPEDKVIFNCVMLDMSDYENEPTITYTGDEIYRIIGHEKTGKYWADKNILRIYKDNIPVYENDNGRICRDSVAIMDSWEVH